MCSTCNNSTTHWQGWQVQTLPTTGGTTTYTHPYTTSTPGTLTLPQGNYTPPPWYTVHIDNWENPYQKKDEFTEWIHKCYRERKRRYTKWMKGRIRRG